MNKFQITVVAGAAINLAVVLLLPPFDNHPLGRGISSFDAFYPVFSAPPSGTINTGLLYFEIIAVLLNAALAWLLLQNRPEQPGRPRTRWQSVVQWLAVADLLLILLFPPFETRSLSSLGVNYFDGFGFALTGSVQQSVFLPLLLLELFLLAINASSHWLAFGMLSGGQDEINGMQANSTVAMTRARSPNAVGAAQFGRAKRDRRVNQNPGYSGPERRHNKDRRQKPAGAA
jgi:hypothetical protein